MTFFGLLMLAQKSSSQYGDGESAVAMWKNSMADYDAEHKVTKILSMSPPVKYFFSRNTGYAATEKWQLVLEFLGLKFRQMPSIIATLMTKVCFFLPFFELIYS